jgi:starch synthase (maltosyl-transferring)
MGFDVLYLTPVHPIGFTNRKGANNALTAAPGDPGSPWAIGSNAGGHTAIEPALGTLEDFDRLVATAQHLGLDVALDIAFQASPDHPWAKTHPQWFHRRVDGSIKYAENPPKKYQDIYPFDFETDDWQPLWEELGAYVQSLDEDQAAAVQHALQERLWHWHDMRRRSKDPPRRRGTPTTTHMTHHDAFSHIGHIRCLPVLH